MAFDGKVAIPFGNTFDKLIDAYTYAYTIDYNADMLLLGNLIDAPVDINNPTPTVKAGDLVQGSYDPSKFAENWGMGFSWPHVPPLVAGTVYTLSLWIQPKYLPLNAYLSIKQGSNWDKGIQATGSEGDFTNSAWATLNGTYSILVHSDANVTSTGFDCGIPGDRVIPATRLLFTKRADVIRSVSSNGATPMKLRSYEDTLVYDISTATNLPVDVAAAKQATFVYQVVPYKTGGYTGLTVELWARLGADRVVTADNGTTSVEFDGNVTGGIVCWAYGYTLKDGSEVFSLSRNSQPALSADGWSQVGDGFNFNMWRFKTDLVDQDYTKPVKVGFFFTGDVAIYGGLRIYNNNPINALVSAPAKVWTRASLTFTATLGMQDTIRYNPRPGFSSGSFFDHPDNTVSLFMGYANQPTPNVDYLPWAPNWSSYYLYGLMINEGTTAGVYVPDGYNLSSYFTPGILPAYQRTSPTLSYPENTTLELQADGIPAWSDVVHCHNGINVSGLASYSYGEFFLNLLKLSLSGRPAKSNDPTGFFKDPLATGWGIYRTTYMHGPDGTLYSGPNFNTLQSRVLLTAVQFLAGATTCTMPMNVGNWAAIQLTRVRKEISGPGITTTTNFTKITSDAVTGLVTFTVDTPFAGNSDPTAIYIVHTDFWDDPAQLQCDIHGYPTVLPPAGYILYASVYRTTPLSWFDEGSHHLPFTKPGHYTVTWDGEGSVTLDNVVSDGLIPRGFPVTEIARTSNSVTYDVDTAGYTTNGNHSSQIAWINGDANFSEITKARTGFYLAITSSDPNNTGNYVRNLKLFEERMRPNIEAGEIFYPSLISRLKDYKCIRFLDWCGGNDPHYNTTIADLPNIDDVSYVGIAPMVPFEVIIELCNITQRDCWINLKPYSIDGDAYFIHIAQIFERLLDPKLRLYIEYGNEQWNGGLLSSAWMTHAANFYNVISPYALGDPNPEWANHIYFYARESQRVFSLFDSVFSGIKGKLQPVRLWDDPKKQKRRLIRCLSAAAQNTTTTTSSWKGAIDNCVADYGIPYDAISPAGYIDCLNVPELQRLQKLTAPAEYPFTYTDLIPIFWWSLNDQMTGETDAANGVLKGHINPKNPNGLGFDNDGDPFNPILALYEGGYSSCGPTPHMFLGIVDLLLEKDGDLKTVYNISKTQQEWWEDTMVAGLAAQGADADACVFNQWNYGAAWAHSGQWALSDRTNYTDAEFYRFPRARLYAELAGRMGIPTAVGTFDFTYTVVTMDGTIHVFNGTSWTIVGNVKMLDATNNWKIVNSKTMRYLGQTGWSS